MPAGHGHGRDAVAVGVELVVAYEAEPLRVHEERRCVQRLRRRRRKAQLAVGEDDGALAVAPPKRAGAVFDQVLARLLLDE